MGLQVIQVIETYLERRGNGTPDDPIRIIHQYWGMDGRLLWEVDPQVEIEQRKAAERERECKRKSSP